MVVTFFRVVMRREQVLKICLNHCLTKEVEYTSKDERTWLFSAADYSDGEISYQQFCIRFKNPETATEFMQAVDDARRSLSDTSVSGKSQYNIKPVVSACCCALVILTVLVVLCKRSK